MIGNASSPGRGIVADLGVGDAGATAHSHSWQR